MDPTRCECATWAREAADELAAHHPDCPLVKGVQAIPACSPDQPASVPLPPGWLSRLELGRPVVVYPEAFVALDPVQWDAKYCPQAPARFGRLRRWLRRLLRRLGLRP